MAHWLDEHKPKQLKVLVSPTVRTRQTATAFTEDFDIVSSLGPDGNVADILAATGWPTPAARPWWSATSRRSAACAPCCWQAARPNWTIKKGALWWFTNRVREGETQTVLRAVIPSDFA